MLKSINEDKANIFFVCFDCVADNIENMAYCHKKVQSSDNGSQDGQIKQLKGKLSDLESKISYLEKEKQNRLSQIVDLKHEIDTLKKVGKKRAGIDPALSNLEKQKLDMEMQYLRTLLNEMADKNMILRENNNLLIERMRRLEAEKTINKNVNNSEKSKEVDLEVPSRALTSLTSSQSDSNMWPFIALHDQANGNSGKKEEEELSHGPESENFEFQRHQKRKQNRNYNQQNGHEKYKKKHTKVFVGTKQDKGELQLSSKSKDSKIWIFLSKVNDSVTEEVVKRYVSANANTSDDDITVKQCNPKEQRSKKKRFMVGVNQQLKDKIYDVNFWPVGIVFERFNFAKGKNFLKEL